MNSVWKKFRRFRFSPALLSLDTTYWSEEEGTIVLTPMLVFEDLKIWQQACDLAVELYGLTDDFPRGEQYHLVDQLRRAAVSVGTNIAEGCGYDSRPQTLRFFELATGSAAEVRSLLHIAAKLGYILESDLAKFGQQAEHLQRSIYRYRQAVKRSMKG